MNLIEKLGGYNSAKAEANAPVKLMNSFSYEQLDKELLEYRRQNNIFEVGDKVVHNWENDELYTVMSHTKDHAVIISERNFIGISGGLHNCIRHATDDEIKVGNRI